MSEAGIVTDASIKRVVELTALRRASAEELGVPVYVLDGAEETNGRFRARANRGISGVRRTITRESERKVVNSTVKKR